tara:strand:- start:6810 stop:8543 length:1734 start_codon:yes stop_codon:yes gene_type:complete
MDNNPLVSVVILGEASPPEQIDHFLTQVINEQTYKNLDILIVTLPRLDLEELQDKWNKTEHHVRFLEANPGPDLISMGQESAVGELVFYKTCGNIVWYPHHIEAHLEEFRRDKKIGWSLSHIEKRDRSRPQEFLNAMGWRIDNPPKIEDIIIDEICHKIEVKPDWESMLVKKDEVEVLVPGMLLKSWTDNDVKGVVPSEITLVQYVDPPGANVIAQPARDHTDVREKVLELDSGKSETYKQFPTLIGNFQMEGYNNKVRELIKDYQPKRIAIKRTIGLGDVIQTEPIVRELKKKYNNAHVTFFAGNSRGCTDVVRYFEGVDEVVEIEESAILHDVLSSEPPKIENIVETEDGDLDVKEVDAWTDDFELKFDLDLAYESRPDVTFIGGYCDVVGLEEKDVKKPQLTFKSKKPNLSGNYVVLCNEGSGWQGKEWDVAGWKRLGKIIQKMGYQIVETAQNPNYHLFENSIKTDGSFNDFLQYCQHAAAYIGADNGVMHVCATFDVPCFVVAGAAVPSKTYPKGDIYEVTADNEFVGTKHKFFFRTDGPMFVPPNQEKCFDGLTIEAVEEHFGKFIKAKKL